METVVIKKELFRNEQEFLVKHIYQWNPEIEQTNKDNNLLIVGSPWVYFLTEENLWVFDRHNVNGVLKKESKEDHLSDYEYEMEHEFDYFCSCNDFLQKSYLKSIEFSDIPEKVSGGRELYLVIFNFKDEFYLDQKNNGEVFWLLPNWLIQRTREFYPFYDDEKKMNKYLYLDTKEYQHLKDYLIKNWKL